MKLSSACIGPMGLAGLGLGLGLVLAGCAAHPIPQDVTRTSTVQIVSRIRCEAQEGLKAALEKAEAEGPLKKKHAEKIVDATSIGFEFKFTMAETSSIGADKLEFEREAAKSGEKFKLALVGGWDSGDDKDPYMRKNERFFRVVDDLKELKDARCRRAGAAGPNLLYPISGSTGMAEVVRTYIELEMLTDLGAGQGNSVTFTDDINFTTTFDADASIDLQVKSAIGTLRLTKVAADALARRQDIHSVKVVLAREKNAVVDLRDIEPVRDKDLQTYLTQTRAYSRNKILIEFSRQRKATEERAIAEQILGRSVP